MMPQLLKIYDSQTVVLVGNENMKKTQYGTTQNRTVKESLHTMMID